MLPGMNYYRLAMVDQDGTATYSAIHILSFETSVTPAVTLHLSADKLCGLSPWASIPR